MRVLLGFLVGLLVLVALGGTRALSQDARRSWQLHADAVLAAMGDDDTFARLAHQNRPDPWIVAEELCLRGEAKAAGTFAAAAATRKGNHLLAAHITALTSATVQPAARDAWLRAETRLAANDPQGALAALHGIDEATVFGIHVLYGRGFAQRQLGKLDESLNAFREAAKRARHIGWLRGLEMALHEAGATAYRRSDLKTARAHWQERLPVIERLGHRGQTMSALANLALVSKSLGDSASALEYFERALRVAEDHGDPATTGRILSNLASLHRVLSDFPRALQCHERARQLAAEAGDRPGEAGALTGLGNTYEAMGEYAEALSRHRAAWDLLEGSNDHRALAKLAGNIGIVHYRLGDYTKALQFQMRALEFAREAIDAEGVARAQTNLGLVQGALGDHDAAEQSYRSALSALRKIGNSRGMATALGNLGGLHYRRGDLAKALEFMVAALRIEESLGDRRGVALSLTNIGAVHESLGQYPRAREYHLSALHTLEKLGDKSGVAACLTNLGSVDNAAGRYEQALDHFERALRVERETGDRGGIAGALANLGVTHRSMGSYATALHYLEHALERYEGSNGTAGSARVTENLGLLFQDIGDTQAAMGYAKQALQLHRTAGRRRETAIALRNLGALHYDADEWTEAGKNFEAALALLGEQDRAERATNLSNLGSVHHKRGNNEGALACHEEALRLYEELGDHSGAATAFLNLGVVRNSMGEWEKAIASLERARALAEGTGARRELVYVLDQIAKIQLQRGNLREALVTVRTAVAEANLLVRGLEDERSGPARERLLRIYRTGVDAALKAEDAAELFHFVETGRARTLLEALHARGALRSAGLPAHLLEQEEAARAEENAAAALLRAADARGDQVQVAKRREELRTAQDKVATAIARIQREQRRVAALLYPGPQTLRAVQTELAQGDALLVYVLVDAPCCLVVTRDETRVVTLGVHRSELEGACSLSMWKKRSDLSHALGTLERLLIAPLKLPKSAKRILVAPDGALCFVPFGALCPARTVVYVPSATTYLTLGRDRPKPRERVLALGDPTLRAKHAQQVHRGLLARGDKLGPLPFSREEAMEVGDETLLGPEASETNLRKRLDGPWRAVHLACHGSLDTKRPILSHLRLAPDATNDGLLTVLDVFRLAIPTDLVVLSACETARGEVYRAEGITGFVRAFLNAGTPRVVVSLWKVDDEATKTLMVKFYELWNPKDGSKGLPTATALKRAQEFVRDGGGAGDAERGVTRTKPAKRFRKWSHPYYWAAWQLWGLPD